MPVSENLIDRQRSLRLLIKEIEQNIRTTDNTIKTFVDNDGILDRMQNERNQVIFGRRGSGKTLLLNNFLKSYPYAFHAKVNLEPFKTDTLADAILNTLIMILEQYKNQILSKNQSFFARFFDNTSSPVGTINSTIGYLYNLLSEQEDTEIFTENTDQNSSHSKINLGTHKLGLNLKDSEDSSRAIKKKFKFNKLKSINHNRIAIRNLLVTISEVSQSKKIFISFDDFYFLPKQNQPHFIDFFHNLCKGTSIILKVATIRQRSLLSIKRETFIGVEIGDDIQPIELDYTLDKFHTLKNFMAQILKAFIKSSYAESVKINDIIDDKGFDLLCVASGGVPRDFLTYFIEICELCIANNSNASINDVYEIAEKNLSNKLQNFEQDAQDDKEMLLECLNIIRNQIISNEKTNIFLLPDNLHLVNDSWEQSIKELADLRLLHPLASNIIVNGNKRQRYNAFLIDMSLYANSFRDNFNYFDLNTVSILEKQKLGSAPILRI